MFPDLRRTCGGTFGLTKNTEDYHIRNIAFNRSAIEAPDYQGFIFRVTTLVSLGKQTESWKGFKMINLFTWDS